MDEFANAFEDADSLFLLDIYPASEAPIEGVTSEVLARKIAGGLPVRCISTFADAATSVAAIAEAGDMILTLGAGNVGQLVPMILEKLKSSVESRSVAKV
jgi:UDP-N-acetylmuramate--alanine ligase